MEREELIHRLNEDLAHEYQAIIMYNHYASKLTGTDRPQLVAFFREEIGDELHHAQFLADKIVALGGEPSTEPASVASGADNHQMLRQVLAAEEQAIQNYSQRLHDADSFGDEGLRIHLESMLAEETNHKEEVEKLLARWSDH